MIERLKKINQLLGRMERAANELKEIEPSFMWTYKMIIEQAPTQLELPFEADDKKSKKQ